MRKVLMSLAVAASALAVASPASAQFYPQPQQYGYGYNNGGYNQARSLQYRVDSIQREINRLRNRHAIGHQDAKELRSEARNVERRLRSASRYGLHPRERREIEIRIARLEQHVRHELREGGRWDRNDRWARNGRNGRYNDRDRDGRDDRYEDDRGRHHD